MRDVFGPHRRKDAQTFVFFALTFGTIFLLCGLAIDSGLLFLAKARMSRAVDGASLAAVGNFNRSTDPATNRASVANILRNFAVANYTDLGGSHAHYGYTDYPISSTSTEVQAPYTTTTGQTAYTYTYNFTDGTKDSNGQYRKYVQVILTTGAGGQITSATCNARCPVSTYFIGALAPTLRDLKVSASSVATRNPRLIMIVLDRSTSMLSSGGGAYGLPQAVVQFLDFFDTSADYIGIVSFGTNARLEMPLTTNFIVAGTNILFHAYETNNGYGTPGVDPEEYSTNSDFDSNYAYSGVRRMKFGGNTAADDGIRLAMEQLMDNSGFNDPDVVKYMVIFTDGAWNQTRTLMAAPGYTNWTLGPPVSATRIVTNAAGWTTSTNPFTDNSNIIAVPTFCEAGGVSNFLTALSIANSGQFEVQAPYHLNDIWQSMDGNAEPITASGPGNQFREGAPMTITNYSILGSNGGTAVYSRYIDVWLPPGSVDYQYTNNRIRSVYVSDLTSPTNHIAIQQFNGESNKLVVPGYVIDGLMYDNLDLTYLDNAARKLGNTYPRYRSNNYQEYLMWPDDTMTPTTTDAATSFSVCNSLMRQLAFRNYPNLLTGFYVSRADDPLRGSEDIDPYTGAERPKNGLGPYYPGAATYWPFDLVGFDPFPTYALTNAVVDPDPNHAIGSPFRGSSRHAFYTINMLSPEASPEWAGEWFFSGTQGTNVISSPNNTSVSTLMTSKAAWQNGAPSWIIGNFDQAGEGIMTNESAHNTNVIPTASVWRPYTFSGTYIGTTNSITTVSNLITSYSSSTGGYVADGSGNIYANSMGYSGRPTHYFDFSRGTWQRIAYNHVVNVQAQPLGFWKAQEYAWHARAAGVTIYTVGYGTLVTTDQQVILAQIANATNTTAGDPQTIVGNVLYYTNTGGTGISYNPKQPIGQQFFATTPDDISNDFYNVGQAINAALTQ